MKIIITEEQITKLVGDIAKTKLSNIPNPLEGIDIEKEAPHLAKLAKMFGVMDNGDASSKKNPRIVSSTPLSGDPSDDKPITPYGEEPMHPLGGKKKITSLFGKRNSKIGSKDHKGVDIATPSGSRVYAPLNGIIVKAEDTTPNGCGGYIKIEHDNIITKYCHLRKILVKPGQEVKKGQQIGESGGGTKDPMRGTSTGPHLHYEILNKLNGIAINPTTIHSNLG